MTGDIIVVKSDIDYYPRDVVTFTNKEGRIVTHRLVNSTNNQFSTKGDANRSEDEDTITPQQIIGKVVFVIPRLGYLMAFSRTLPGLLLFLIVPVGILALDELIKIKR